MFAMQASTLKVESRRNEVYTLKASLEKSKRNSETPVKMKTDYKLKKPVQEEKDDRLVENFLTEINEI